MCSSMSLIMMIGQELILKKVNMKDHTMKASFILDRIIKQSFRNKNSKKWMIITQTAAKFTKYNIRLTCYQKSVFIVKKTKGETLTKMV